MKQDNAKQDKPVENDAYNIPEEHKQLVRDRIKNAKLSDYIDWNRAQKKLRTTPK